MISYYKKLNLATNPICLKTAKCEIRDSKNTSILIFSVFQNALYAKYLSDHRNSALCGSLK
jgi:hypothetical protein